MTFKLFRMSHLFSRRQSLGIFWLVVFALITIAPLAIVFIGDTPPFRSFWIECSVAIGFIGLSLLGMQFLISSRIHWISTAYGIDIVLQFHRMIAFVILLAYIAHPVILFVRNPPLLSILNPIHMPMRTWFAMLSTLCFLLLIIASIWRKPLNISFETWRVSHGLLAIGALGFALMHVLSIHYYLQMPWKRGLWTIMVCIVIAVLVYVRLIKPKLLLRTPWRVIGVKKEGGCCWTVSFEPVGHRGMRFYPGQFSWLIVGYSPFMIKDHPFTMSSSAENTQSVSFTIKERGDFTEKIKNLTPGTIGYLDGPYGVLSMDFFDSVQEFVFIAGGVGITPMISMLRTMADRKDRRTIQLIYAANVFEELIFYEEIKGLQRDLNLKETYVLRNAPENWSGEVGLIDEGLLNRHIPYIGKKTHYFVCGSKQMNRSVRQALRHHKVPMHNIHIELFDLV